MSRALTLVVTSVCLFSTFHGPDLAGSSARLSAQSRMSKISVVSMIREWVKLAAEHKAGEADAAAQAISDWQATDLFDMFVELKQLKPFKNRWVERRENPACPGCSSFWSGEKSPTLK